MSVGKRAVAELVGTAWLVLGGCGAAVLTAKIDGVGIGYLGVALAFGLTVLTGAYALGAVSGAHFNPAVSIGLAFARRFSARELPLYVFAQVVGAIAGALVLYLIANGADGFDVRTSGFAANGFGAHSPGGYNLGSAMLAEIVMTFMFVMVILGVTDTRNPTLKGFAPLAIGLTLTLIHLVAIPITNTSVNPARSTGSALFVGDWALAQLWVFWVAPLSGAAIAGVVYPMLAGVALERPIEEAGTVAIPPEVPEPAHVR